MSEWERPKHLRLVTNEPPIQKRKVMSRTKLFITAEQRARLATVLRNLRHLYGTYTKVAEAMGMCSQSIINAANEHPKSGSMMMMARAAHLAQVPVDAIIYGTLIATDRCSHCGQKLPEQPNRNPENTEK